MSVLWPGEGAVRENLGTAGHRKAEMTSWFGSKEFRRIETLLLALLLTVASLASTHQIGLTPLQGYGGNNARSFLG